MNDAPNQACPFNNNLTHVQEQNTEMAESSVSRMSEENVATEDHWVYHDSRCERERLHRQHLIEANVDLMCPRPHNTCQLAFKPPHYPLIRGGGAPIEGEMTLKIANDCCNKTVGIYLHYD